MFGKYILYLEFCKANFESYMAYLNVAGIFGKLHGVFGKLHGIFRILPAFL